MSINHTCITYSFQAACSTTLDTREITLISFTIFAIILNILAIVTIYRKTKQTTMDITFSHMFINNTLFAMFFTPFMVYGQRDVIWANEFIGGLLLAFTSNMAAHNAFCFLTLTVMQKFIAVYRPLKVRIWVTMRATRLAIVGIYLVQLVLHSILTALSVTHAIRYTLTVWIFTNVVLLQMVLMCVMHILMISKFVKRCCFPNDEDNNFQKQGEFHDKKVSILLILVTLSSITSNTPMLLKQSGVIQVDFLLLLILMWIDWTISPLIYIIMNMRKR